LDAFLDDKELLKLFSEGKSRKLRLPNQVIEKVFSTVQKIEASVSVYDLWADKGLRFEKLTGSENRYSMRLSGKFRLEMRVEWKDEEQTIGIFFLLGISNHYGD
jgi:plasmid maintenance system killer protein